MSEYVNGVLIGEAGEDLNSAATVAINDSGQVSVTGSIGYEDDYGDYFRFVASDAGRVSVSLINLSSDIDLSVYDAAGTVIAYSYFGSNLGENVSFDAVSGSAYYISIDPYYGESNYSMRIAGPEADINGSLDRVNNISIGDAGESIADAAVINSYQSNNISITGSVGYSEDYLDTYKYSPLSNGVASINLTGLSSDLDLDVYDSNGLNVAYSYSSGNFFEGVSFDVYEGVSYYVYVIPYSGNSTYFLDIFGPDEYSTGSQDIVNGYAIGDADDGLYYASSVNLNDLGDAFITGSAGYDYDYGDVYNFVATGSGIASVDLTDLSGDLDLAVYDDYGMSIANSYTVGDYDESVSFGVSPGKTYFVEVYAYGESNYSLIIDGPQQEGLYSTPASENIYGTADIDTVIYSGSKYDYDIDIEDYYISIREKFTSVNNDTLYDIERIRFSDGFVALDIEGSSSAGGIYRTYQAAFDRVPDVVGLGYWIDRADNGATAIQMAEEFVWSEEFQSVYGVNTNDNYLSGSDIESVVEGFYQNVLGRTPDQGGLSFYTGEIESGQRTVGRVLAEIADSNENRENILPTIQNGINYDLWLG